MARWFFLPEKSLFSTLMSKIVFGILLVSDLHHFNNYFFIFFMSHSARLKTISCYLESQIENDVIFAQLVQSSRGFDSISSWEIFELTILRMIEFEALVVNFWWNMFLWCNHVRCSSSHCMHFLFHFISTIHQEKEFRFSTYWECLKFACSNFGDIQLLKTFAYLNISKLLE